MTNAKRYVLNTWYAAAWEHEIAAADNIFARKICDMPLVFYRTEDGGYVALDDRCCHRAAPLSIGRIEGSCIRCMYHGLLYNQDGVVVEIPGQSHISKDMRVRSYPVASRGGMVWIWLGDPELADRNAIHDMPALSDPSNWKGFEKESYLHYEANALLIIDNLADFTHVAVVHTNTLGGSEEYAYESTPENIKALDTGVSITRWHENSSPPPFHRRVIPESEHDTKLDRCNDMRLHVPGIFLMETLFAPVGFDKEKNDRSGCRQYRNCQFITPETWHTTHFFWNYLHNYELNNDTVTESLKDSLLEGFLEDKVIIEKQQKHLEENPDFEPRGIGGDKALQLFRNTWAEKLKLEIEPTAPEKVNVKAMI